MDEEYRIMEDGQEHELLMDQARKIGENIVALSESPMLLWGPTLEELEQEVPHPHLTEYALAVMEGMGLVAHTDGDDPYWDEYERKSEDEGPGFRLEKGIDPRRDAIAGDSSRTAGGSP